jgi:uncharacterized protein (TIGR03067 family)
MKSRIALHALTTGIVSLAWLSAFAGPENTKTESDLARLQGRWTARAGAKREVRVVLEIQGKQVDASIRTPQGIRFQVRGEVKIDATTSPRSLDWIKFSGADQQELPDIRAIYKIDQDTFTVCNGGLGGRRPTEFTSGDGILAEVVVFARDRTASAKNDRPSSNIKR